MLEQLKCKIGFHKWKYFSKGFERYRVCERCGKIQKEVVVDIGYDEYSYTAIKWEDCLNTLGATLN